MKYVMNAFSWIWSKRKFLGIAFVSAVLFFMWGFPFGDMSDLVTSQVARATGNQIYLQFESMDLNLLPAPAISVRNVSVETPALPALEAKWMKISPSWFSILFNLWTIKKASGGDPEAAGKLGTRIGVSVAAEGLLGGDVDLHVRPGSASDQGADRSKVSLAIEKMNLNEVQKWADLPVKMNGVLNVDGTLQYVPSFTDQPEGEIDLRVNKFNLPASTLMIPFEGAMMPVNLPSLTLDHVVLRGRLSSGKFVIEEGTFGSAKDPLSGRIKGQIMVRLMAMGGQVTPQVGQYNLTVDMSASKSVEKDIGIAFLLFDQAKTPTANGSRYLFQANGHGFGATPQITRINSF